MFYLDVIKMCVQFYFLLFCFVISIFPFLPHGLLLLICNAAPYYIRWMLRNCIFGSSGVLKNMGCRDRLPGFQSQLNPLLIVELCLITILLNLFPYLWNGNNKHLLYKVIRMHVKLSTVPDISKVQCMSATSSCCLKTEAMWSEIMF